MNTALIILDAQNDFFTAENPNLAAFEAAAPIINAAIAHFSTSTHEITAQSGRPGKKKNCEEKR